MAAGGGSQCGYCTPGFVVSLFAEQYRPDRDGTMRHDGAGRQSLPLHRLSADPRRGTLARARAGRRVSSASRCAGARCSSRFRHAGFSRPPTRRRVPVAAARRSATRSSSPARPISASSPTCSARRWPHLISLEAIDELREFSSTLRARHDRRGASAAARSAARWTDAPDAFREWLTLFASPLIRNRATLGGNLATASPIGDAAPLLLALDAVVHVAGPSGRRIDSAVVVLHRLPQDGHGARRVDRRPSRFRSRCRSSCASTRSRSGGSTTSARSRRPWRSTSMQHGKVRRARFAFGGVAATPLRVAEAEAAVVDQPWNDAAVERVQAHSRPHAAADERSSRIEGVPPRGVEDPGREVPVGARAVKIDRHAGSARERPRPRHGRGAVYRRPLRAISEPASRVAGVRAACARARHASSMRRARSKSRAW